MTTSVARGRTVALAVTGLLAASLLVMPGALGLTPQLAHAGAVVLVALALWATTPIAESITALAFFLAAMLLKLAPPGVVFSGFSSSAFWLVFGGILVGAAVRRSGLGERIARVLVGRIGGSYLAVCGGVGAVMMVLAFLMPSSMGRVVLMLPIVLSLADALGYGEGTRGRTGLVLLTGMMGFNPPAAILTAVVPNLVMAGASASAYGVEFHYLPWLLAHLPTTGLVKAVLVVGAVWALFRQPPGAVPPPPAGPRPLSAQERKLAVILVLTLGLWATDSLHGIPAAWVALAGGLACLLPPRPLLEADALQGAFPWGNMLHLAGLLGLGAVVAHSGLGQVLGGGLLAHLPLTLEPPGGNGLSPGNFAAVAGVTALVGLAATIPGAPAVMVPLADSIAQRIGAPLNAVLMAQVVGYTTVILPYQVPPLIVAMQMGKASARDGARLTLSILIFAVPVVWPLTWLWWRLTGL